MDRLLWFLVGAWVATRWLKGRARLQEQFYEATGNSAFQEQRSQLGRFKSGREWEERRARFAEMSRHAGEAMIGVSEATLEALLVVVQALREKLAENQRMRAEHMQPLSSLPPTEMTGSASGLQKKEVLQEKRLQVPDN